ncbi:MAG: ParB/RepB/Spo0J family partition protein [Clostridiales Family XIII bacterium]|jgi:ParB family chromosome partitioning protein|nr:ParB/RepB/Spo0J family partition protein [Clostridiales Family XIII bacterium]
MGATKKKGLGRGFESLFGENAGALPVEIQNAGTETLSGALYVDIHEIKPNAKQPRKQFKEETIDELAASIEAHGVIQPLIVRPLKPGFELVAGERRWRAAKRAGLKTVPCIVREIDEEQNLLFALIENMQREDLNPMEEADGIKQAMDAFGLTQEEISKSVGKSRPYVANALRLLKLPDGVRKYLAEGKLSGGHGKAIASMADPEKQMLLADYLVEHKASVREAENLAGDPDFGEARHRPKPHPKNNAVLTLEEELRGLLGTKVSLNNRGSGGKIEIHYYSGEELEGIIDTLRSLK